MPRSILCILALMVSFLAVQNSAAEFFFVQLADMQFGMFASDRDFAQETVNYEFVVANINRIRPRFVVICGDLINKVGDAAQTAEYLRITAKIDPSIPVYAVPGNHDVGNEPTPETLAYYRQHFGPDHYSFVQGSLYGIVLNSGVISAPGNVQEAAAEQEAWLKAELAKARSTGARHIVVFQHHSWFLEKAEEPNQYFNIPMEPRRHYLDLLKSAGVRYVFAGHYHRNAYGRDGDLEMITSGPVGQPLGTDPSGIRIVTVRDTGLEHRYYTLGNIPNRFPPPAGRGAR
ncbi:MAG TPA: metallophosphoesterase [Terriglobia bacterium]|nr:metallophosphoesterase [Terriglobia bacterium]